MLLLILTPLRLAQVKYEEFSWFPLKSFCYFNAWIYATNNNLTVCLFFDALAFFPPPPLLIIYMCICFFLQHIGPAIPEVSSIWFKLYLYHVTGQGPPSLLLSKGSRLRKLPDIFQVSPG